MFWSLSVKPWTPEKISGMFILSRPITCEMKPPKITDKPHQGSVTNWCKTNELALSSTRNLQFSFVSLWKSHFYYKPTLVTWICLLKKPNFRIDRVNCKNLQRYRFVSWVKASQLPKKYRSKTTNHSQVAWPFELYVKQTPRSIACDWLIFSCSQTRCLAVSDPAFLITSLFRKMSFISIIWWQQRWNRKRKISVSKNSKIKDSSWRKKRARCFVSSRD